MVMSIKIKLTKRVIDGLPLPDTDRIEYQDTDDHYLRLVISAQGRYTWRYTRKTATRGVIKYTIGTYPDTTPDMARRESLRLGAEFDAGRDPVGAKKERRAVKAWSELFDWYMENHAKPHKRTWPYDEQMEERYLKPWRSKPVTTITADVVTKWHKRLGAEHGEHQADRCLAMVKTVFSETMKAGIFTGTNPAAMVRKFHGSAASYGRTRNLDGSEVGRLLKTLHEYHDQDTTDLFMVLLFTGARKSNVMAMRWPDMKRDPLKPSWTVPGTESKNKEPMVISIVEPVISILNRRWEDRRSDEWVFPAKQSGSKTPHVAEVKRAWKSICETAGLQDVRIHDLRRTLGSWQASLGASLQVIGRSLGHKSMQSTEIYARLNIDPVRESVGRAAAAMLENGKGGAE